MRKTDRLTLIAISALAYVMAVALHEHGGHAAACLWLGSHPRALGAFYVDCDDAALTPGAMRLVALAGPAMSLLTGILAFGLLRRIRPSAAILYYFVWLLGGIGLMSAAGYPLFSGVSGLGDLGTSPGGALYGATPAIVWRAALAGAGLLAYFGVVRLMCRAIAPYLGNADPELRTLQRATRISYFTGALVYLAIGSLNPLGWVIILTSVLPSSMGGTSGLLWMWRIYRSRTAAGAGDHQWLLPRSWSWICASILIVGAYAAVFGRTWQFTVSG